MPGSSWGTTLIETVNSVEIYRKREAYVLSSFISARSGYVLCVRRQQHDVRCYRCCTAVGCVYIYYCQEYLPRKRATQYTKLTTVVSSTPVVVLRTLENTVDQSRARLLRTQPANFKITQLTE